MNCVIPVVDSLENALIQARRENAAINALCKCLLSSLERWFEYLLNCVIHQAATALGPRVKSNLLDFGSISDDYYAVKMNDVDAELQVTLISLD